MDLVMEAEMEMVLVQSGRMSRLVIFHELRGVASLYETIRGVWKEICIV
jgi:hypothetical protein